MSATAHLSAGNSVVGYQL